MRGLCIRLALPVALSAVAGIAAADSPMPRTPGLQDQRPQAPAAVRPPLPERTDGRAAVRGCPVDNTCARWQEELREFELEAFSPAASPWIDGEHRRAPRQRAASPAELRPDLPWLADLEMPDLPIVWDRRVVDYLVFYKEDPRGRRIMRGWLEAQGRYRDLILRHLRAARLPDDLLYVAMIESSYDATTYSRVGASGLWQFMPAGGRIYGLYIDRWLDERNDPVRSTEAVMSYWADLHQRFGDWHLAMAAYNAGYGAVLKGVAKFNTNDFWALLDYENALPWESSIYVPKALAAAIVGHNRKRFGFDDLTSEPTETWDDVTVPASVPLSTVARAASCSVDDVKRLNPHLRKSRTPPGRSFVVRVPRGHGAGFAAALGQARGDWDKYDTYVVGYGERFEDVATQFGLSRRALFQLNELEHESEITGGSVLLVPRVGAAEREKNLAEAHDNLYGSGVDHQPGETLIVAVPDKDAHVDGRRQVFYRVVFGDSLWGVARALGVPPARLAEWNGLAADAKLHPRMVLQAWIDPNWSEAGANVRLLDETRIVLVTRGSKEHLELSEARSGRERFEYTARKKESFAQIGKKYGLSKRDVARINRKSPSTVVQPGETIILYRAVDPDRSKRARSQWKKSPRSGRGKTEDKRAGRDDERGKADAKTDARRETSDAKADAKTGKGAGADAKADKGASADAKAGKDDGARVATRPGDGDGESAGDDDGDDDDRGDRGGDDGPVTRPE